MEQLIEKFLKYVNSRLAEFKCSMKECGLSKFKKQYKLRGEVGRGGFGIVYRGTRIFDDLPIAVKFIERTQVRNWAKIGNKHVPMEIYMLNRCSNFPGVIKMLDWYGMHEGFLIVMERPYPCADLFDFIKSHKKLTEEVSKFLFKQILLTVYNCKQNKVIHRDLKDENVVIDLVTGATYLVDFGAATVVRNNTYSDFQGTRLYCPPEWFLHSTYLGNEATVWSLGVLLYNMLNGRLPFHSDLEICKSHLLGPLPFYVKQLSSDVQDFVAKCLQFEPKNRLTLEQMIAHPWIQSESPSSWSQLLKIMNNRASSSHAQSNKHGQSRKHLSDTRSLERKVAPDNVTASGSEPKCSGRCRPDSKSANQAILFDTISKQVDSDIKLFDLHNYGELAFLPVWKL